MRIITLLCTLTLFISPQSIMAAGCVDPGERIFADVPATHLLCAEIESLYRDGMTGGCGTNENGELLFCPNEPLTRAAGAQFAEYRDPFAQVGLTGKTLIGDHVHSTGRFDKGQFWVQFTRNISHGCSQEAWARDWDGPGVDVDIQLLWGTVNSVFVETKINGNLIDMRFNARIHCK